MGFYSGLPRLFQICRKTFTFLIFVFVFRFVHLCNREVFFFTVFTDVQLFEVNQAGDGGGQVGQVVIGHAQLLQGLAVEELLWRHRGETMEYHSPLAKIAQTFSRSSTKGQRASKSAGGMHHIMLWKSSAILSVFVYE